MITIPSNIRKKLERSLPSEVLNFLNDSFRKAHEYCERAKELEAKVKFLEEQINKKDDALMMLYSQSNKQQEGSQSRGQSYQSPEGQGQMGYMIHSRTRNHYDPLEFDEDDYEQMPEFRRGKKRYSNFEFRRGVPGSEMRRGGSSNEFEARRSNPRNEGQGGGSGSGGGGTSSAYKEVEEPTIPPIYRDKDDGFEEIF